uniref:SFRICE_037470 n=1 Tax=Spodoptera frugiperda TaxID=7108 RepID=A0A2H1VCI5_SPOFR
MKLLFNSVHCTVTLLKLLMGPAFPTDYSEKKCRNKLRGLSHSQSANMVTKKRESSSSSSAFKPLLTKGLFSPEEDLSINHHGCSMRPKFPHDVFLHRLSVVSK